MRVAARISYDGTNYAGWQRQNNATTVQAIVEEKFSVLFQEDITVVGCGRTDTGVHAKGYVLHFDIEKVEQVNFPQAIHRLNLMLPSDISVQTMKAVSSSFHARFDAIERTYEYHLHTVKDPFAKSFSTYYPQARKIDRDLLYDSADIIRKYDDYATFCKSDTDVKTTICAVSHCEWSIGDDMNKMTFRIVADRYLRGMIRLIVGTSINVALGKLSMSEFDHHVRVGSKPPHIYSAPPQGLFLKDIVYPITL